MYVRLLALFQLYFGGFVCICMHLCILAFMDHPLKRTAAVCLIATPCPLYIEPNLKANPVWIRRLNCSDQRNTTDPNPRLLYQTCNLRALNNRPPAQFWVLTLCVIFNVHNLFLWFHIYTGVSTLRQINTRYEEATRLVLLFDKGGSIRKEKSWLFLRMQWTGIMNVVYLVKLAENLLRIQTL